MSSSEPAAGRSGALAWGRLLRLSLLPTAVADALAGLVLGGGGQLPSVAAVLGTCAACASLYEGGLVLNDWHDRRHDAATRPERPLPSGEVSDRAALAAGVSLLLLGLAAAALVAPAAAGAALVVAALVLAYDLGPRGPWRGPLLLAGCRAADLSLGILAAAGGRPDPRLLAAPALYGAYVLVVSRLGRLEDGEDGALDPSKPPRLLRLAASLLWLPAVLPIPAGSVERAAALALTALGAVGLFRRAASREPWTRLRVARSMGLALRRLLLFTSALAVLAGGPHGPYVGAALLLGYPLARALSRTFPPS